MPGWTSLAAGGGAAYWVEEVDLNGAHTMFGPVFPEPAAEAKSAALSPLIAERERSALKPQMLSELGRASALTPDGRARSCGPANSGSLPFQRTGGRPAITPTTRQRQYALAAGPAIKISVCAEGWYRLTQPQLVTAGLSPNVDPRLLQLYVNGREQPMIVSGQADGKLDPQDTVEFYGYPLNTTWSGTQVYWLVAGSTQGKRVRTEPLRAEATTGPANFPATVVWNPRTVYFAALLNGDADNFFGPVLGSGSPVTNSFTITNLDTTATTNAQLEVSLQGVSSGAHVVGVQLNGYQAGTVKFSDQKVGVAKLVLPISALEQGSNNVLTLDSGGRTTGHQRSEHGATYLSAHLHGRWRLLAPHRRCGNEANDWWVQQFTDQSNGHHRPGGGHSRAANDYAPRHQLRGICCHARVGDADVTSVYQCTIQPRGQPSIQ